MEYTHTVGVGELTIMNGFLPAFYVTIPDARAAAALGVEVGEAVVYFPRRAYDLWNTRYMIVPFDAEGWGDLARASASFLFQSAQI